MPDQSDGLAGEVAVVTGASRGIGRAIALALAASGRTVVGCGRLNQLLDLEDCINWQVADVSDPDAVGRLLESTQSLGSRISVLVNNAGIQIEKEVVDTTDDDWELLVGVNCRGVFNTCRAFIPAMKASGGGSIVNIGSIAGVASDRSMAIYNATKGFVHALTRSVALDHGPLIRCNAVSPGWIMTEMAEDAFALANSPEAAERDAIDRHPVGRLGRPSDIAQLAVWLASNAAEFVNGQCIVADGGLLAGSPIRTDLI